MVLVGTLLVWLRARHRGWREALRLVPASRVGREVAIGAGLGVAVRIVAGIAVAIIIAILASVTNEEVAVPEQVTGDLQGFQLVVFAVFAVVVAPITEEFLFRGLIYRSIRDRHGVAIGALVSAMLFGACRVRGPTRWRSRSRWWSPASASPSSTNEGRPCSRRSSATPRST